MSSVMVVVDRFTKYIIFILSLATCLADRAARLFLKQVVNRFSVPVDIVSEIGLV